MAVLSAFRRSDVGSIDGDYSPKVAQHLGIQPRRMALSVGVKQDLSRRPVDFATLCGAKLAERSTYPQEAERSWRSVRHIHESRSEAGGAFDISTRAGAKLAERSTYPREPERSWRSVRHIHKRRSEAGEGADVSTRRDVKSPAYPNTFTP